MSWHDKLVPEDFAVPETFEHPRFRLRKLTIHDVDEDLDAIRERVLPAGTPEPWLDTTRDENLVDLGWHQKEFELRRSFNVHGRRARREQGARMCLPVSARGGRRRGSYVGAR